MSKAEVTDEELMRTARITNARLGLAKNILDEEPAWGSLLGSARELLAADESLCEYYAKVAATTPSPSPTVTDAMVEAALQVDASDVTEPMVDAAYSALATGTRLERSDVDKVVVRTAIRAALGQMPRPTVIVTEAMVEAALNVPVATKRGAFTVGNRMRGLSEGESAKDVMRAAIKAALEDGGFGR